MTTQETIKQASEINIGIIAPAGLLDQTKKVLKAFPNFKPVFRVVEARQDNEQTVQELMELVDVLMFTDYYLYQNIKENIDFKIPVHHVPLMGTGLYRSLVLIKNSYGLEKLSIDILAPQYVRQVLYELEEDDCDILEHRTDTVDIESMVQFHFDNYQKFGSVALTGIQEVSNRLTELGTPHEWVTPTNQDMIVSLERALLSSETRRNKESQIVFGYVSIDNYQKLSERFTTEHDVQLLNLQIQQKLLDFIKQLDGHFVSLGGEEYLFITTRGTFERETRGYKFLPLLKNTKDQIGITLSLGVGFGQSAAEAGNHARLALRQSKEIGGNVCYIVREDRSVIGPVDLNSTVNYEQYELSITDAKLLDKAEKAGMSAAYMAKLMARVARHNKIDYTAQELASTLNITIRSAHRILLKWMDAELVDIIGEEKVTFKGRPRRIYRLSFIQEEHLSKN
ncbi:hypothetical protein [Ornithinibacillus scapharcae]|uniref:hypothetical protein n=1 Tax=Ornithinibacillus scapharcae TaxID=1147159 RepID=UPI000225AA8D|nr:hypothetical protein [Ornithinibacillus scapharcae]